MVWGSGDTIPKPSPLFPLEHLEIRFQDGKVRQLGRSSAPTSTGEVRRRAGPSTRGGLDSFSNSVTSTIVQSWSWTGTSLAAQRAQPFGVRTPAER